MKVANFGPEYSEATVSSSRRPYTSENWESVEAKLETILFHSEDERVAQEEAVPTVWRAE